MSVVRVVNFNFAGDPFVPAGIDRGLQGVGVIEVLHCFRAEIDTELFKLARLGVFKAKHVKDADKSIRSMPHSIAQDRQRLGRFF